MSLHIKELQVKYLSDDYCCWCERDLEDAPDAEFVLKFHKNSDGDWVAFSMHNDCFLESRLLFSCGFGPTGYTKPLESVDENEHQKEGK